MSTERSSDRETFFARWSRLKTAPPKEVVAPAPVAAGTPAPTPDDEPPPLPRVEELTIDSDFRGFLHPKVDESVRRAALRKLFSDPHFNVMDGLDVYIDDYTKADPIPPDMLAGLTQAKRILRWAEGKDDEDESASAGSPAEETPALAAPADEPMTAAPRVEVPAEPLPTTQEPKPDRPV